MVKREQIYVYGFYGEDDIVPSLWSDNEQRLKRYIKKKKLEGDIRTFHKGNLGFYYGKLKKFHKV